MKTLILLVLSLLSWQPMFSQSEPSSSPYFMVISKNSKTESLPLKSTNAHVNISGVIADVVVEQTYSNEGNESIEAIYVFPGSTNAAVYGMEMTIGNRTIKAKIEEKNKAIQAYETAKTEGKRASLLEQHKPNVFQMNVANIMPGDIIQVKLSYTELIIPKEGIYEFVYPTVVGPRYINGNENTNTSYSAMPYQSAGKYPLYDFNLDVHLATGVPVQQVTSPSHKILVSKINQSTADITLEKADRIGNRDFVLNYHLKGNKIETGLLAYDDGHEKFFLCMMQPPKQVETSNIPPREYIFVVDVSGSMRGFPLEVSKKLLTDLISGLRGYDRFNVVLFSGGSQVMSPHSMLASRQNIDYAVNFLTNLQGGGGTELMSALQTSMSLPRDLEGLSRSIIVVTDGYVGVEPEAFEYVRTNLNQANLFAFGIGTSVNRHLIEGLAKAGQGIPEFVLSQEEAPDAADRFRKYISSPVLTQITASFDKMEAYDIEPISIPDILAERPVILFGKYKGALEGQVEITGYSGSESVEASVMPSDFFANTRGSSRSQKVSFTMNVNQAAFSKHHQGLKYLWARERLKRISDMGSYRMNEKTIAEITSLGLTYNLLTAYTSFVAVDDQVVNTEGEAKQVKQALPMPEGVPNEAIGGVGFSLNITGVSGEIASSFTASIILTMLALFFVGLFIWKGFNWMHSSSILIIAITLPGCREENSAVEKIHLSDQASVITFILGDDATTDNSYYKLASAYFHQFDQDGTHVVVEHIRSFEKLQQYLSGTTNQKPWSEINLVIHGNQWTGVDLPFSENDKSRTDASSLLKAFNAGRFLSFPDHVLNSCTQVNVHGCSVGKDTLFVNMLSKWFTNSSRETAGVYANPNFTIFYASPENPSKTELIEAESYYVSFPIERTPCRDELIRSLKSKYPNASLQWNEALQRSSLDELLHPYAYQFHIPISWTFLFKNENEMPTFKWQDDIRRWVGKQPELNGTLKNMNFKPENFWWTAKPVDFKASKWSSQPAMGVRGSTRIYCVLVPILEIDECKNS